jgi:phosphoribosylformylglycinamidine synthase
MTRPTVLILRAAGTNCDEELAFAFESAGALPEKVHINRIVSGEKRLADYAMIGIPGGFTYGDDIAAGRALGNELANRIGDDLRVFVSAGKPVIGICNGFQVLVNTGLLPGPDANGTIRTATLTDNESGRFEDRWTTLRVEPSHCLWTRGLAGRVVLFPSAHAEGKFLCKTDVDLNVIEKAGQVAFRYAAADGGEPNGYPDNPNGSPKNIAGVCNAAGNVLGLMPHPERHVLGVQHPHWTRSPSGPAERGDGFALFVNAVEYVR